MIIGEELEKKRTVTTLQRHALITNPTTVTAIVASHFTATNEPQWPDI